MSYSTYFKWTTVLCGVSSLATAVALPEVRASRSDITRRDTCSSTRGRGGTTCSAYTRRGCYTDKVQDRALSAASYADNSMSVENCATFCTNYNYFGVEFGRECFCANSQKATSILASDSDCNFPCAGDSTESCGAGNRIEVYNNNNFATPGNTAVDGYTYAGCYIDSTSKRSLSGGTVASDDMTPSKCAAAAAGYNYFGLEYGRECWFGNTLTANSAPEMDCSFRCSGDSNSLCGAGNRLNVYVSTTPYVAPTGPSACPASNGEIFKGKSGKSYQIECAIDHVGGDFSTVSVSTLAACLEACDAASGCVAWSWVSTRDAYNNPCYLKSSLKPGKANAGVMGGKLVV